MTSKQAFLPIAAIAALLALPTAGAQSTPVPAADEPMERALAKAQEGPDELRRFVARTAPIYMLDWNLIAKHLEARRQAREAAAIASAASPKVLADMPAK